MVSASLEAGEAFFVSPSGNDLSDGRSAATPWKTVAKVNASSFKPGDVIAFQRGGVWRESLKPTASGAEGQPITFTAYGEGNAPVFDGSESVSPASPTAVSVAEPVFALLAEGVFLRAGSDWTVEGDVIRLSQPLSGGTSLSIVRREDAVNLQSLRHIVLRGLAVNATAKLHGGYGFRIEMCEDILLEDCAATRCGKHHFGIINSTRVILRRCHASLVMPDQGQGGASAFVSYSDKRRQGDTSRYEDCVVENYADAPGGKGMYPAFVTHGEGIGSVSLSRLTSRGAGVSFNNRESGAKLILEDSLVEDASIGLYGTESVVRRTTLRRGVLTLDGRKNMAQECRLLDLNPGFIGHQSAMVNSGTENRIEDTVVTLDPNAKPFNAALALVHPQSALIWRRCTFTTPGCVVRTTFPDVPGAGCTAEGNTYPTGATFQIKGQAKPLDLAAWRVFGLDVK